MNNSYYGKKSYNKEFNRERDANRINWQIKVPQVRVVKGEEQLGIMSTEAARNLAQEEGLDLVEIVPNARPPVCKIMDYGKYKYEQKIKKKEEAKLQRESQVQLKAIRLRPSTADNDIETKINQARKFLEEGSKVQLNLILKGAREMAHKEQGFATINKMISALKDAGVVENYPKFESGRVITCCLAPKK